MPGLDEVLYYLNGIYLLLKQKQEGFGWLDLTSRGLARSFWAFVWCLPAFAVIWASWRLYYLAGMPAGTTAGLGFLSKVLLIEITGWLMPLVLLLALARPLGYGKHLATVVTASNWISVPFAYAMALPVALSLILPQSVLLAGLLLYAVFGASVMLQFRLVWMCVGKQNLLAAAITAIYVLPPMIVAQELQRVLGTLPG
ncbi:hypothetical protein [Shinella zoogloeoides]|uniref:hypothetical protein n=1 Tax=Shinella zoogloeoides TaxID=352475 RepID=UPI00299F1F39|nr:hypothetical protein [Shinella zoogloeoides]WPE18920.1 hypothetical protein ShzoTeo12_00720 [Shinella zoogloeoides]